jgi:tetratricopeptide (TPR) repeat protein
VATRLRAKKRIVRQRAKGPIDPSIGARIRELRTARGLTQADLAGPDFTKGFISLLETGRTRISLRAADILAARLGTSAPELLAAVASGNGELELLLLRGDQQAASGEPQKALEHFDRVLPGASGGLKARTLRSRGRALVEAGRAREALTVLEEAGAAFGMLGQRELEIRTLYDRAVAHSHLDEPGNALALALECESAMRMGGLVDKTLELKLRSFLATTFARAGDLESADFQARQALRLADDVVDLEALGTLYSTVSVSRQQQSQLDEALKYARKSLGIFEELGRDRAIGQMWHNLASIHLSRGNFAEAEKAIDRGERVAKDAVIPALDARLIGLRAELAAAQRRWKSAEELALSAEKHSGASAVTRGRALLVRARALASRRARPGAIREVVDQAADALKKEPAGLRAEVHDLYARLLADRGEWKSAYAESRKAVELIQPRLR